MIEFMPPPLRVSNNGKEQKKNKIASSRERWEYLERDNLIALLPEMLLKPKKPPDPLQPHLLCSLLSSMHSFSFGFQSLSSLIEHHLKLSMPTLFHWCSSPSSFFAAKFGSYAPEGKPTTLQIRLRSRSVLFPTTSNCRSVSGTIGAVPLNRFANVFPLCEFQVCGLNFYSIIFLLNLF